MVVMVVGGMMDMVMNWNGYRNSIVLWMFRALLTAVAATLNHDYTLSVNAFGQLT